MNHVKDLTVFTCRTYIIESSEALIFQFLGHGIPVLMFRYGMFSEAVLHGAGGMDMIDPLFQRILVSECRRRRIPIIFDEVLSGCWRFGAEVCALSCFVLFQPLFNSSGHKMQSSLFLVGLLSADINHYRREFTVCNLCHG